MPRTTGPGSVSPPLRLIHTTASSRCVDKPALLYSQLNGDAGVSAHVRWKSSVPVLSVHFFSPCHALGLTLFSPSSAAAVGEGHSAVSREGEVGCKGDAAEVRMGNRDCEGRRGWS